MNIEIANRLVSLRKSNNLSQEALAEKLGISRQAVSKWERAEASPDTDNLIQLSRLYGISLDELLKTEDEIPMPRADENAELLNDGDKEADMDTDAETDQEEYVHVGFQGVHVKDKEGEVHVGWNGIHVEDKKEGSSVHIGKKGIKVNGEPYDGKWITHHAHFPMFLIILIAYFVIGCLWNAWHPGWLLFFLVPIWHSLVEAVRKQDARCFAYPVFITLVYLMLGAFGGAWHPGWVVFLTIPLYYALVSYFRDLRKRDRTPRESAAQEELQKIEDKEGSGDLYEE